MVRYRLFNIRSLVTCEYVYENRAPVRNLKPELAKWLLDNDIDYEIHIVSGYFKPLSKSTYTNMAFIIDNDKDAVLFQMVWGDYLDLSIIYKQVDLNVK